MEDIFHWCRAGHSLLVRAWLEEPEHDLEQGDEHGFSPLHWSAFGGRAPIAEMLIVRGAKVAARNAGDDTPLHLAAAHGHREVADLLLRNRAPVDAPNAHGNTPLHYACFWGHQAIAEDLIQHGALVSVSNAYGETPLDKAKGQLAQKLLELAVQLGQDTKPVRYKDIQGAFNTRPRDGKLSRHSCIELKELAFDARLAVKPSGESWRGTWQKNGIVAKLLSVRDVNSRVVGAFLDEFPRLRIFGNPNVLPLLGCCCQPPTLVLVSQLMRHGSLFQMLHSSQGVVVDAVQALRFALDVARGMAFLHSLDPFVPRMHLSSKHVMVDADLTARVNMADAKFSFQEKGKIYDPAWMAPEALQKTEEDRNVRASDMWSFAILLWELATRQVPFASLSPMQTGMQIALEGLRVEIPAGAPPHLARLIGICMNEDPGKRPSFDMILPILEKMNAQE